MLPQPTNPDLQPTKPRAEAEEDDRIRPDVRQIAARDIFKIAFHLTFEQIQMYNALEVACGILSARNLRPGHVGHQAVRETINLHLQNVVLQVNRLKTKIPEVSRPAEPDSVAADQPSAAAAGGDTVIERRRRLADATAVIDTRLTKLLEIQQATGIPCRPALQYLERLVNVGRELRQLDVEDAQTKASALGIEFPNPLALALKRGDVYRLCKILNPAAERE